MGAWWNDDERAALVALLRARPDGMKWPQIVAEVDSRSSALAFWNEQNPANLFDRGDDAAEIATARADIAGWGDLGFLTFLDDDYPAQLREIHDLPPVLFHRGKLLQDEIAVSVVGSRKASQQGLEAARSIAAGLVQRGITVVGGLASGIDTAAHVAALEAGGRTVAVIGTGIRKYYPAENRELQDQIATEGLLLSQFWPDAPPTKQTFPMRNTVMSGYGRATIVVEAGEHSGARIQARRAVSHARPVILTDMVVKVNKWAQELSDRPGVYVAKSTAEVMTYVEQVTARPADMLSLLRVAAG
ncbi:DNA-processing protein DprA [Pseudonocardia endophytica]|uniref:DNA-processing protein DprA n=1 Tax=Pseudonocardia endophytica TaxID=401976 RepID=UPI001FB1FC42|nr:DNA-processing protein DprA [Pseudonocardia endophytica]